MSRLPIACHVPECHAPISRSRLMCLPHWRAVPLDLRRAVNRTWKIRKDFGHPPALREAHLEACAAAIASVMQKRKP